MGIIVLNIKNLTIKSANQIEKDKTMSNQTMQLNSKLNVQPVPMDLKGDAGKRVILNTAKRIMKTHAKEIKALADK